MKPPAETSVTSATAYQSITEMSRREVQILSGCITWCVPPKLGDLCRQEIACHPWKCKDAYSITKKTVLDHGGVEKWWQAGWDTICDWNWQ